MIHIHFLQPGTVFPCPITSITKTIANENDHSPPPNAIVENATSVFLYFKQKTY